MSLLDDVSIVVTPNGYKAGELYAVVPVPTEGAELVTNGDFSNGLSDWIVDDGTSWTNVNNTAFCDGNNGLIKQGFTSVLNKRYKVTFDVVNVGGGELGVRIGSGTYAWNNYPSGSYVKYLVSGSSTSEGILFYATGSWTGSIDNVTVKEYTAADMDVTRATAATRVDENGLVNYAEILGSELVNDGNFDSGITWSTPSGWEIIDGKLKGTNVNAISTTQGGYVFVNKTFKVTYTLSGYVQGYVRIYLGGSQPTTNRGANGTYTETLSISASANTTLYIQGISNFTGSIDNVSIKEVTRDNVPRIDYTGGGCPHILAEPQRTNLVTYSESFGSGKYFDTYNEANEVSSNNTSPSGIENATQIISTGQGKLYAFISLPANTTYSFSFYAKNVDATEVKSRILASGGSGGSNLTPVSYISQLSTTEWTKITHIFTTNSTAVQYYVFISHALSIGGNIQIWGAQLELGSFPTSLIPTSGSTVTRNQDQFTRDGIGSLINSTEGVLFVEMAALSDDSTNRQLTLSDGSDTNRIVLKYDNQSNIIQSFNRVSGVETASLSATVSDITQFSKIAIKYKLNDYAMWIDGVEVDTDNSSTTFPSSTLNKLSFGTSSSLFAKVKQLQVYKTALTDEQLIQLTGESGTDFYESYAEMAAALNYTIQ